MVIERVVSPLVERGAVIGSFALSAMRYGCIFPIPI